MFIIHSNFRYSFKNVHNRLYYRYISGTWIGLKSKDGVFTWTDGSVIKYPQWKSGQPDGSGDCVLFGAYYYRGYVSWLWNDVSCTSTSAFICEMGTNFTFIVE